MSWRIEGDRLQVDGLDVGTLPYSIEEVREVDGTVVMVLNVPNDVAYSRNVFGYVLESASLWQIGKYYPGNDENIIRCTGISPKAVLSSQVYLYTWLGVLVLIDLKTGAILRVEVSR